MSITRAKAIETLASHDALREVYAQLSFDDPRLLETVREMKCHEHLLLEFARETIERPPFADRGTETAAADRMAYQIARLVKLGILDARSGAADAMLDYIGVGSIDGPSNVPEWVAEYEKRTGNSKRED